MIGIGIIGTGGIAQAHAEAIGNLAERARLVAISETDPARARAFAEKHGAKISEDRRELLADPAVRMVCICTPNATHASFCVEALEAGKAVLCEKPIAGSLAELDRIDEARRAPAASSLRSSTGGTAEATGRCGSSSGAEPRAGCCGRR